MFNCCCLCTIISINHTCITIFLFQYLLMNIHFQRTENFFLKLSLSILDNLRHVFLFFFTLKSCSIVVVWGYIHHNFLNTLLKEIYQIRSNFLLKLSTKITCKYFIHVLALPELANEKRKITII